MNKKILGITAAVAVVILLAGFTTFWFLGSSKLKNDLAQEFAKLNEKAKAEGGSVTYESMSSGGFPFSVAVTLNKVHVKGVNKDQGALKLAVNEHKSSFDLEMDQLVFSKSLFGSSERIGGMKVIDITLADGQGGNAQKLRVDSSDGIWVGLSHFENASGLGYVFGQSHLPQTDEEWNAFAKNIKSVEYNVGKTTLTDVNSSKVLWEGGSGELKVAIEKQADERRKYDVKIVAKDMDMKPELGEWIKSIAKHKKELPPTFTSFFSSSGKSSYDVEFSVIAPQSGLGAIDIDLKKLAYKVGETISNTKGTLNVDILRKSGSLKISGDYKTDPAYRERAKKNIEDYAKLVLDIAKSAPNANEGALHKAALMSSFISTFAVLMDQPEGKVDIDITVPGLGATIKQAELRAGSYGLSINGEVNLLNPTKFKVYARVYGGRALAAKYVQEFEKTARELGWQTSSEVGARLNELLDMAVATPDPKDLIFSYSGTDNKIGTLTLQDFNAQLGKLFEVQAGNSETSDEKDDQK